VKSRYFGKRVASSVAVWGASSLARISLQVQFDHGRNHLGFIIPVFPEATKPMNGRRARLNSVLNQNKPESGSYLKLLGSSMPCITN
jgi:hypothetical protein